MKVRDWVCGCGHTFTAPVLQSQHTRNLSGEATAWCPKCGARPMIGSPWREVPEEATNPKEK